eukprot:SRR837773.372.p2 GENE.SRR837773.372~~SRR837773.372.p2  ORF type:complete len:205 (-),score=43.01 SRR837773.372:129-689(-)
MVSDLVKQGLFKSDRKLSQPCAADHSLLVALGCECPFKTNNDYRIEFFANSKKLHPRSVETIHHLNRRDRGQQPSCIGVGTNLKDGETLFYRDSLEILCNDYPEEGLHVEGNKFLRMRTVRDLLEQRTEALKTAVKSIFGYDGDVPTIVGHSCLGAWGAVVTSAEGGCAALRQQKWCTFMPTRDDR